MTFLVCPVCSENYDPADKGDHLAGHDYLLFRCKICQEEHRYGSQVFIQLNHVQKHLQVMHNIKMYLNEIIFPQDLRGIRCDVCNKNFLARSQHAIKYHNQCEHSDTKDSAFTFFCRSCNFKTQNVQTWANHFQQDFSVCKYIKRRMGTSKSKTLLKRPSPPKTSPPKSAGILTHCFFCYADLDNSELGHHIKTSHREELFRCKACSFQCKSSNAIRIHFEVSSDHGNSQLFLPRTVFYHMCCSSSCKYTHTRESNVIQHMKNCHAMTNCEPMVKCRICSKDFDNWNSFKPHECFNYQSYKHKMIGFEQLIALTK